MAALPRRTRAAPAAGKPGVSAGDVGASTRTAAEPTTAPEPEAVDPATQAAVDTALTAAAQPLAMALMPPEPSPLAHHVETLQRFGATPAQMAAFEARFGAQLIPSASAGRVLADLNDHVGVLKIPAYDGPDDPHRPRSVVTEQFAVIKAQVPALHAGEAPSERLFVKGYGDRLIDFHALEQAMAVHSPHAGGQAPIPEALSLVQNAMETPLRSDIKRLSLASTLVARRNDKESDEPVMPLPPNPTPMAWRESWANSDAGMSPGAGPMLPNGTRKFQLDYNTTENRLLIFRNDNGQGARRESLLSDSLPDGTPPKLAPAWCEGPTLAEVHGIRRWEDMGPATDHRGVKQGNVQRLVHTVMDAVRGAGRPAPEGPDLESGADALHAAIAQARPGAHLRITTEDGAVHDLHVDEAGICMALVNPKPARAHGESLAAFGGAGRVQADVDVYSYQGRDTGLHGSKTGFPDPRLVTSTGDALPAGPLLKDHGSTALQAGLRLITFQPLVPDAERGKLAVHVANVALTAASKFACVMLASLANEAMKGADGRHVAGAGQINAAGAGQVSAAALAGAAAGIVVAQEVVTAAFNAVGRVLPDTWKRQPESSTGRVLKNAVLPMAEEMLRLTVNLGLQKAVGIQRGGAGDWATMGAASVLKGGGEQLRQRAGLDRANHPWAHTALDVAQGVQYNAMRALGNALSATASAAPGAGDLAASFAEALVNRLATRGYDQILVPMAKEPLNALGVVGANASAFDSQLSHQYRVDHLDRGIGEVLKAIVSDPASVNLFAQLHAWTDDQVAQRHRTPGSTEFFSARVLSEERAKQTLNRVDLALQRPSVILPYSVKAMARQLGLMQAAMNTALAQDPAIQHNVEVAGRFGQLQGDAAGQLAHLQALEEGFDDRVASARRLALGDAGGGAAPGASASAGARPAMTNALEEAAPAQRQFVAQRVDALAQHLQQGPAESSNHRQLPAPQRMIDRPVPSAANPDYGNVARPFGAPGNARIARDHTTFSTLPQARTFDKNQRMAAQPGIDSIARNPVNPFDAARATLPAAVLDRIELAVRNYTVESQFFHYPLRWQVTGELQRETIAPGIDIPYNVMNRPGNVSGSKKERVDPIEALYINLGARISDKFPTEMFRAVVTEAVYKARLEGDQGLETVGLMTPGNQGVLTEILSATMSPPMAAGFNLPISNYLSAPRENSLRIDLFQETGVNIAKWADLVQGEVVMVPGAVLQVQVVDERAGRPATARAGGPAAQDAGQGIGQGIGQDIGQVVYMKAVDTYALERAHDHHMAYQRGEAGARPPQDGDLMIDPKSGHFFKYEADKNDIVPVSATKNYFTGRPLENTQWPADEARWRKPYTSDGATRSTKDAIHMAIVRNDPIVPHLDMATDNVHHAWFRDKARLAGTFNEGREAAEQAERLQTRERARAAGQAIAAMTLDTPLHGQGVDSTGMLAWLGTSLLRQPIRLVPVDDSGAVPRLGDPAAATTLSETYDKVDLQHPRQSITGRHPPPALLVGVGEHGYYAVTHQDGEFNAAARLGEGKTVGNLLHAVVHAGHAKASQYALSDGQLSPDRQAQASVEGLMGKLQQFAQTDYLVLQRAMVQRLEALQA